jgi:hypothetical protein
MTSNTGQWQAAEVTRAAALWQRHFADHYDREEDAPAEAKRHAITVIARALGRDFENVFNRMAHYGPSFASSRHRGDMEHANALREMQSRREAASYHTLTGAIMGDPPPGFSALDKRVRP